MSGAPVWAVRGVPGFGTGDGVRAAVPPAAPLAQAYPVRALPAVTISCSHEHAAWPGTVSISAKTLYAVVTDIFESLKRAGISRLVLINGHGGNYVLRNLVQEATVQGPVMALYPATGDWVEARAAAGMQTTDHQGYACRRIGNLHPAPRNSGSSA